MHLIIIKLILTFAGKKIKNKLVTITLTYFYFESDSLYDFPSARAQLHAL